LHSHISPFCNWKISREDIYKRLRAFIPNKYFFCVLSQCRSKTFLNGWKNMFLRTPSVEAAGICGCMWSWSWEHDKFLNKGQQGLTKLNTNTSSKYRRFIYPMYGSGRTLLLLQRRSVANLFKLLKWNLLQRQNIKN
jgi:hypothetical protein